MDPMEFERFPFPEKVRLELIGKCYAAARIVAVLVEAATSKAYRGLNGPLPQFTDTIMAVCSADDRCMIMTCLMYLHGALRLMRRYGIPFSCDSRRPMRQITNDLLNEGCIRELLDQYNDQFEFLSMELAAEEREDFFFRAMPNGLAEDLNAFRAIGHYFPETLPKDREDVVGIKGLECPADFCMSMLVNRIFQDWIMQFRELNREDYRRIQYPQVIKLVHDHIHRLKRGRAIHLNVLYPRFIPVNTFNDRGLYEAGIVLPAVPLDWTREIIPEAQIQTNVPLPPPCAGVRSQYAPIPVPRVALPEDRGQAVRPKDPTRLNSGASRRNQSSSEDNNRAFPRSNGRKEPPAPPRGRSPGGDRPQHQLEGDYPHPVPARSQSGFSQGNRYGAIGTGPRTRSLDPRRTTGNTAPTRKPGNENQKISSGFVREALYNAVHALNQEVDRPAMTDQREGDTIDPLQYHVLLAKARERTIKAKSDEEIKRLKAGYEQELNRLQQTLIEQQRLRIHSTEYGMIQLLQGRGFVFNSCDHCLVRMEPCPHVKPVEMIDRPARNPRNDREVDSQDILTPYPEPSAPVEEPVDEPVLIQVPRDQLQNYDAALGGVGYNEGSRDPSFENDMRRNEGIHAEGADDLQEPIRVETIMEEQLHPTTALLPPEAQGSLVPQAPHAEDALDNAPYADSDSENPTEPNIVWSCQATYWEDDRDLHGPQR